MRNIIKDQKLVQDNYVEWTGEDELPPSDVNVLVKLDVLTAHPQLAHNRTGKLGIKVAGETEPAIIEPFLAQVALIAVEFPKFSDGRGYSLARLLRERYRFAGELRAVGDVLRDQLFFLHRVGFNAFAVREDRCSTDALNAFSDFTVTYQGDVHDQRPIYHRLPN